MIRKLLAVLLIMIFLIINPSSKTSALESDQFLKVINAEIESIYGIPEYYKKINIDGDSLRKDMLESNKMILYGGNHDYVTSTKKYRYIGYTYGGDAYPNMDYPPDEWAMKTSLEHWKWVENPYSKIRPGSPDYIPQLANQTSIKKLIGDPTFNYNIRDLYGNPINDRYLPNIVYGIGYKYSKDKLSNGKPALDGTYDDVDANGKYKIPWHRYVHVLQPPTDESWGLGVMVHKGTSQYWYVTVHIAPNNMIVDAYPKIVSTGVPAGQKAIPGEKYTAVVEYYLKGSSRSGTCTFKMGSTILFTQNLKFQTVYSPGIFKETREIEWTCPQVKTVNFEANITPLSGENNTSNNKAIAKAETDFEISEAAGVDGCFLDTPKKNGSSMEVYVIRGVRHELAEPVKVRMRVWLRENVDDDYQFSAYTLSAYSQWGTVFFDEDVILTPEKPYWIKKFSYPIPEVGKQSGIIVQTGNSDIDNKRGVENFTWHTDSGNLAYGTHTTGKNQDMDWLPWETIKTIERINRP